MQRKCHIEAACTIGQHGCSSSSMCSFTNIKVTLETLIKKNWNNIETLFLQEVYSCYWATSTRAIVLTCSRDLLRLQRLQRLWAPIWGTAFVSGIIVHVHRSRGSSVKRKVQDDFFCLRDVYSCFFFVYKCTCTCTYTNMVHGPLVVPGRENIGGPPWIAMQFNILWI